MFNVRIIKNNKAQKVVVGILFTFLVVLIVSPTLGAAQVYKPIVETPLIDSDKGFTTIEEYLNQVFIFALGIATLLAIIQITLGGINYMVGSGSGKIGDAKDQIWSAVTGILIILATYIILNQINPRILDLNFGIGGEDPVKQNQPSDDARSKDR